MDELKHQVQDLTSYFEETMPEIMQLPLNEGNYLRKLSKPNFYVQKSTAIQFPLQKNANCFWGTFLSDFGIENLSNSKSNFKRKRI